MVRDLISYARKYAYIYIDRNMYAWLIYFYWWILRRSVLEYDDESYDRVSSLIDTLLRGED